MYYTYFSTGNGIIDGEHARIDELIDRCTRKGSTWTAMARRLIAVLADHLDNEERICDEAGLNMTGEHRQEHHMLKIRLAGIERKLEHGNVEKEIFLNTLRDLLFYHISHFDRKLRPCCIPNGPTRSR
jgi:hemerythrin-like metal-binding protein